MANDVFLNTENRSEWVRIVIALAWDKQENRGWGLQRKVMRKFSRLFILRMC